MIDPQKEYRITVVADSNDADYVTRIEKLTGEEINTYILPVLAEIKRVNPDIYNWYAMQEYGFDCEKMLPKNIYNLTEDQIDWFDELVLPGIEGGTHSIESISIVEWVDETPLFP